MDASRKLPQWAFRHAVVLLAAGVVALLAGRLAPVAVAGGASLLALVWSFRGGWTPAGAFGLANALTLGRAGGTLLLALAADHFAAAPLFAAAWLLLFLLDAVDGAVARRRNEASLFGEYLDKESDALFVMLLCFSLYQQSALGGWVLALGALRYVFVVGMRMVPGVTNEYRSPAARYIFVSAALALMAVYVLPTAIGTGVALAGGAALVASFLGYFAWLIRERVRGRVAEEA